MPSPIAEFDSSPGEPGESNFTVTCAPDRGEHPGEDFNQELNGRRMWVDGLVHFLAGFSRDPGDFGPDG